MQRRYVWRSTRVRDLFDSLYRGYPSGAIRLWQAEEAVPLPHHRRASASRRARILFQKSSRSATGSAVTSSRGEWRYQSGG